MTVPRIITQESEIATYNTNKSNSHITLDPGFNYNPFRRLSAYTIDRFIIEILKTPIIGIIIASFFVGFNNPNPELFYFLIICVAIIMFCLVELFYYPVLVHYKGQTFGQKINSLILTDEKNQKLGFGRLCLKSLFEFVNIFFPIHLVSIFSVPMRDDRKSVSDLVCSTHVKTDKVYPNMVLWSSIAGISAFIAPFLIAISVIFFLLFGLASVFPNSDYPNNNVSNALMGYDDYGDLPYEFR